MAENKKSTSFKDQIKMGSQKLCEGAIKTGWIFGLISLGSILITYMVSLFSQNYSEMLNYFLRPWLMADVVFITIMTFFIYKKSRIAATLMFLYFVLSKFIQWYELGEGQGLGLTLVFTYVYFNAMRGTFLWHSKYKNFKADIALES